MARLTLLTKAIRIFRKSGGILTMTQALEQGIHRRTLYALRDSGKIERMARGLYRLTDLPAPSLPDLLPVAKKIPKGVVCLISALSFHGLTTQIPHFVYIALPQKGKKPSLDYPPLRVFWYTPKMLETGVETRQIDGCKILIFNREKTLIDCLKFRNKIGLDIFLEAFKFYWTDKKRNLDKLVEYAKIFRVYKIIKPILETFIHV